MGGTFDVLTGKVLPGTYMNFESTRQDIVNNNPRGVVVIPLIGHTYGPTKGFFSLYSSSPDAEYSKLGMSVYDDNDQMLLIREAFKNAREVIVYIMGPSVKASATAEPLTATAKYAGSLGNKFKLVVTANPIGGFDVNVYLGESLVFTQAGAKTVEELEENDWVDFSGTGALAANAGVNFTSGADTEPANKDITDFLDAAEKKIFNVLCFPSTESTLHTSLKTKIKYLRDEAGRGVQAVVPDFAGDYEGIINVTNSVVVDEKELTHAQACAFVAGITASADYVTSNTYKAYEGATDIVDEKTYEEAEAAVKNGEFFFVKDSANNIVIQYDINSLVTYADKKDKTYSKNRVIRVQDSFRESVQNNFPPNMYDNDETGWNVMEGKGKSILKNYYDAGAIKNVDYDNDFLVDRSKSTGDETYFNIYLQPVDSAEKLFFTVKTN